MVRSRLEPDGTHRRQRSKMGELLTTGSFETPASSPAGTPRRVRRIAHRAGNSRRSLQAAVAAGADWLETDLWYQYGRLVARHERAIWRLPLVYDSWRLRAHFRPLYLQEILELAGSGPGLFLDFKGSHTPLAEAVVAALRRLDAVERTAVCGQHWPSLDEIARVEPGIRLFYSLGRREQLQALRRRIEAGFSPTGVSIGRWLVTESVLAELHERGLQVFVWTVNDSEEAAQLAAWGVDGITSDRLEVLAGLP